MVKKTVCKNKQVSSSATDDSEIHIVQKDLSFPFMYVHRGTGTLLLCKQHCRMARCQEEQGVSQTLQSEVKAVSHRITDTQVTNGLYMFMHRMPLRQYLSNHARREKIRFLFAFFSLVALLTLGTDSKMYTGLLFLLKHCLPFPSI